METIKLTKRSASTIAEAADLALEHIPMTFSNSDRAPGRKVFFPIPMKRYPKNMTDFVYFYAESKLADPPKDLVSGFTDKDVSDESGVYLFKLNGKTVSGCTYGIEDFLNVIPDPALKTRIARKLNEMRQMVHLDDSFLDIANLEWNIHKTPHEFGIQRLH